MAVWMVLAVVASCGPRAAPRPRWEDVPKPGLGSLTEEAALQTEIRLREVAGIFDDPAASDSRLAAALSEIAEIYHGHGLTAEALQTYDLSLRLADSFRCHYLRGLILQAEGHTASAEQSFARALALEPEDLAATIRRAQSLASLGSAEAAEALFSRALDLDPASATALTGLAELELARGDGAAAVERLQRALEIEPGATRLHYRLALAYRKLGQLDLARRHLALQGSRDVVLADPVLDSVLDRTHSARWYLRKAEEALASGDLVAAAKAFATAADVLPESVEVRLGFGTVLARQGDYAAARRQFDLGLELEPENATLHQRIAELLIAEGLVEQALARFRAAIDLEPADSRIRLSYATTLERLGQGHQAAPQYEAILEQDPDNEMARVGWSLHLIREGKIDEGLQALQAAAAHRPSSSFLRINLANVLLDLGKAEEAMTHYQAVIDVSTAAGERRYAQDRMREIGGAAAEN